MGRLCKPAGFEQLCEMVNLGLRKRDAAEAFGGQKVRWRELWGWLGRRSPGTAVDKSDGKRERCPVRPDEDELTKLDEFVRELLIEVLGLELNDQ